MFKKVMQNVNFPEMEKKILADWEKTGLVEKYLSRNKASEKRFSFLDGPITANNPMGVHHAWGRTYKDLWQRYFNMKGYRERFQNGFDCQGLWVEVEVEKELGIHQKKDIENLVPNDRKASIAKFVELCKARVMKYSQIQTEQSKRLGYFMDWDNSYYTMSDENNFMIWHFLKTCHRKGWIYKGPDSVPWCPRCETAISQHEMLTEDYKELTHKSIYMRLPLAGRKREYLLVWTTTPWTIPANIAVAVDGNLDYVLVREESGDKYWVTEEAVERLFGKTGKTVKKAKGAKLTGLKYRGAFDNLPSVKKIAGHPKFHSVIPTDVQIMPISTSEGTGLVHTAVSAGQEDFTLGKKLDLPMIAVIADNADYLPGLGKFSGQNAKKHPEIILDHMQNEGFAWKIENYTHRYPACWRCKTELVWKVTEEWYIAMDRPEKHVTGKGKTLRQMMKETAQMIDWRPKFGLERELDWLLHMHDWLISKKNRYWGLALPIFECQKCANFEVLGGKEELKKRAVSGWEKFEGKSPHKPYIDEVKIKCSKCTETVSRVSDVGNVWLDAGIVPFSTYVDPETSKLSYTTDKKYWQDWFPVDFITESFPGQFKNWFYSMIAMSTVLEKRNPFKIVLGYASVLGEDGRPMHKSWGNAINFNQGADSIGVDVMRWMFACQNAELNILFGYRKADETRRGFHLLLWNIYNFFVTYAGIDGFNPKKDYGQEKHVLDRWIISELNRVIEISTESLDKFDAVTATSCISSFVTNLSQWYIRRSRGRVGPTSADSQDKFLCHQTIFKVLLNLSRLLAPFVPFLSEEIHLNLTDGQSVHLAFFPESDKIRRDKQLSEDMDIARKIVEKGHSLRKSMGIKVRRPLIKLKVETEENPKNIPAEVWDLILAELNVKNIVVNNKIKYPVTEIKVSEEDLEKEGRAREIVRRVQLMRKEMGLGLTDKIKLTLTGYPPEFEDYIKKETLSLSLESADKDLVSLA
ncbi:isoleucine--tRNA ligase [Candidatus Gottesmanbacteria bacterium RIFCSPHIGHO2_01_FULL_42_27]|uniref:Isoleucine--tRNA ligase n=2 Tax=Candidatus Gottesmaniibacteriota TaxID=1752720 RepID=A0A1F6BKF4_9BACT|nr:MAG: Isoleucyl-tRNA synthetase [Candidatus Gottesmanbacteria bacterium GW2011_GWA2_42_18]KKS75873.1 MAG: Isoleucyl-tRNA synthetase [Candidatus Gottesmanbacteria bacterium GW2011_GWC2_42_8]OGG10881.1 MAG: isoleucine--tRNA ligase [Candidatus Gottesmanbacteria bacterium RIFCSPHIGHO2_01_FULL_42_27]OGG19941.1 MAG: isoleucine--tRNA ligase [Candidatus Gottesmanbacteria bacterium RIFCSPHIGHO2_12_FULL_43_26]OGG37405.1 MAG: isoleucine--tRNA ligase [Candidatus Gottesmanbacteria bacterium RIFCSPLOWO2_01